MKDRLPWKYLFRIRRNSDSRGWFRMFLGGLVFLYVSFRFPMGEIIGADGEYIGPRFTGISFGFMPLGIRPGQTVKPLFKIGRTA